MRPRPETDSKTGLRVDSYELVGYDDVDPDTSIDPIIWVTITTEPTKLSLSSPNQRCKIVCDLEILVSSRPGVPITVNGASYHHRDGYIVSPKLGFVLVSLPEPDIVFPGRIPESRHVHPNRPYLSTKGKDMKLMEWNRWITIPATGSIRIEHESSLTELLEEERNSYKDAPLMLEDLKPGMRFILWLRASSLLNGFYAYWGGLEDELKDKKLSDYFPGEVDSNTGEPVISPSQDEWAWRLNEDGAEVRGNIGRFGPVIEMIA